MLTVLAAGSLLTAAPSREGKAEPTDTDILAWIDGEELTFEEYDDMTRFRELPYSVLSARRVLEIKRDFFAHLVERRLLIKESGRRGYSVTTGKMTERLLFNRGEYDGVEFRALLGGIGLEYARYRRLVYEDLLIEQLLTENKPSNITVSRKDIDDYYFSHLGDFHSEDRVRALHIFLMRRKEAEVVLTSLKSGADFRELARRKTRDLKGEPGIDLGYFQRDEMPAVFFDSCWRLPKGSLSKVVKSEYGYHVFKVLDKSQGRMLAKREVEDEIAILLRSEKDGEAYKAFLTNLREASDIKIRDDVKFLSAL